MKRNFLFFACFFLLVSCELTPFKDDNSETIESEMEENSTLFSKETEAEADYDIYVFETNKKAYINSSGYTLWCIKDINTSEDFEEINVTVYKESGKADAGYGVVFLRQTIDESDFLVTVMINTKGQYIIGKVIDGTFTRISEWKKSDLLNQGYGVMNTIEITYSNSEEKYIVCFNGTKETDFVLEENVSFYNSGKGYVAVISGSENFPEVPVKVTYKENGDNKK